MTFLVSNTKRPALVTQGVSDRRSSDAKDKVANRYPLVHGGTHDRATMMS